MRFIGLLILFNFIAGGAYAYDCEKHPIYCQIVKNRPKIAKAYAFDLSNRIYVLVKKYKLPTKIFTAILMQESRYELNTKRCTKGLALDPEIGYNETMVCTDFGIGQVHYKTLQAYGFDAERLILDLDYSLEAAAIVLRDFKKRYARKEVEWYTRYNAVSPDKRKIYLNLIERYL